jgi:hypothetical protein
MEPQRYALEPNGPLRLQVSAPAPDKGYQIEFDGQVVAEAARAELTDGKNFKLPDGSTLQLKSQGFSAGLEVVRNGVVLSDTFNWPPLVKNAGMAFVTLGTLSLLIGLASLGSPTPPSAPAWLMGGLGRLGGGAGAVVLGVGYLAAANFTFGRSKLALRLGAAVILLDSVLTIGQLVAAQQAVAGTVIGRLAFVFYMVRGLQAIGR